MKYLINHNNEFNESYTKEDVQNLINEKRIGLNTEIWTEDWGEWRTIKNTDFNLQNAIYITDEESNIPKGGKSKRIIIVIFASLLFLIITVLSAALVGSFISDLFGKIVLFLGISLGGVFGKMAGGYIRHGNWFF